MAATNGSPTDRQRGGGIRTPPVGWACSCREGCRRRPSASRDGDTGHVRVSSGGSSAFARSRRTRTARGRGQGLAAVTRQGQRPSRRTHPSVAAVRDVTGTGRRTAALRWRKQTPALTGRARRDGSHTATSGTGGCPVVPAAGEHDRRWPAGRRSRSSNRRARGRHASSAPRPAGGSRRRILAGPAGGRRDGRRGHRPGCSCRRSRDHRWQRAGGGWWVVSRSRIASRKFTHNASG